jgi:transposase-like protein
MSIKCKFCASEQYVKNGYSKGKQRYKCKKCSKNFKEGDLRERYDIEKKLKVVKMYLEGVGIRSIERLEGVPNPLIIKWIRKFSKILKAKLNEVEIPDDVKKIRIIELDELFSYCKKKLTKSMFGLAIRSRPK